MACRYGNLTNCKLKANLQGHQGYINTVTVSPDGSLCASGGKVSSAACSNKFAVPMMWCIRPAWHVSARLDEMAFKGATWRGALCVADTFEACAVAGGSSA